MGIRRAVKWGQGALHLAWRVSLCVFSQLP